MLGRKTTEQVNAKIGSIIGADMVVEGNIKATEAIRVEGNVKGDVSSEGTLVISSTGKVIGNIKGNNIMIAGTIEGDLFSGGRTEVASTGKIIGNIRTKSLIVDENAVFQGQCSMNPDGSVPMPQAAIPMAAKEISKETLKEKASDNKDEEKK